MNYLISVFCIFFILKSIASSDLSNLSLDDFNSKLEHYDYTLVFFHSSNCSSTKCRQAININRNVESELKDQFREKKLYKNYDEFVNFVTIDCDQNRKQLMSNDMNNALCNAYSVLDLPEWILFRFGTQLKRLNNVDGRSDIVKPVQARIKTISIRFNSFGDLLIFLRQSKEPVVIGLFVNINDRLAIDRWLSAIEKTKLHWNYKDVSFCHIFENYSNGSLGELQTYMGASAKLTLPRIVIARQPQMIHKREKRFLTYEFGSNKEDINGWIKRKVFGLIIWRSRDNENEIEHPLIVAYYDFDFKHKNAESYKWRNLIYGLAVQHSDLNFALSNSHTFRKHLNKHNLKVEDYEPLFVAYDVFGYGYKYDDVYSEYEFNEFLNEFRTCHLEPIHQKSSGSFDDQTDDRIIELSTLNFPKHVTCSKRDVFILFYANWCEHCKASKLAMQELESRIHPEDQLTLAQMDASANEVPVKLVMDEYPTFFLYRSSDQTIIKFESTRNLLAIVNFLATHSTRELVAFDRLGNLRTPAEQALLKKNRKEDALQRMTSDSKKKKIDVNMIKNEL